MGQGGKYQREPRKWDIKLKAGVVHWNKLREKTAALAVRYLRALHTCCSVVVSLGDSLGSFSHTPPPQYAGLYEAVEQGRDISLLPFRCVGHEKDIVVDGPSVLSDFDSFVPSPIDTSKIVLPDSIMSTEGSIRVTLGKNIHEIWSKNKIEAGFSYAPVSWWGSGKG